MTKVNSISAPLQLHLNRSWLKTGQKVTEIVLPPLFVSRLPKDGIEFQSLIKNQGINQFKINLSTLKHLNCSKISTLRYFGEQIAQNNQKTLVRPWAAKNRKQSKENKPQISKLPIKGMSEVIKRRRFSKIEKTDYKSMNMAEYSNNATQKYLATERIPINNGSLTEREGKFNVRGRMNSCRVATKKTGFPFSKKQYEYSKISEHFEKDEKLSTIPSNLQEQHERFISFDSYTQLVC